ncbi:hypothetical protein IL54_3351 [Sphingobium sp. ba1]|nr:hypothetical protein IL54_3351 [Sphingobium sp. ba1]
MEIHGIHDPDQQVDRSGTSLQSDDRLRVDIKHFGQRTPR